MAFPGSEGRQVLYTLRVAGIDAEALRVASSVASNWQWIAQARSQELDNLRREAELVKARRDIDARESVVRTLIVGLAAGIGGVLIGAVTVAVVVR